MKPEGTTFQDKIKSAVSTASPDYKKVEAVNKLAASAASMPSRRPGAPLGFLEAVLAADLIAA